MNNQNSQENLLRQLAKSAKQRLKERQYEGKNSTHMSYSKRCNNIIGINSIKNNFTKSQITIKVIDESSDDEFYNKVRQILSNVEHGAVVNPISKLVDREYMNSLNSLARQRYIFDIAEKYNKIKQEYYNEEIIMNSY